MSFISHPRPDPKVCEINFQFSVNSNCRDGYDELAVGAGPLIGGGLLFTSIRATRKLPATFGKIPDVSGIYKFEIDGESCEYPAIYIGKASSLKARIADYVEMTRRIIGLYHQHPVWTDGNGFRYVHYRLARALLDGKAIKLLYFEASNTLTGQDLARLELLEISHAVMNHHVSVSHVAHPKILNCYDAFRSKVHTGLSPDWLAVQNLL